MAGIAAGWLALVDLNFAALLSQVETDCFLPEEVVANPERRRYPAEASARVFPLRSQRGAATVMPMRRFRHVGSPDPNQAGPPRARQRIRANTVAIGFAVAALVRASAGRQERPG